MSVALLPLQRSRATPAAAELGRVLDAQQIRAEFFLGRVSREWVLAHVAPDKKWFMGRAAVWYEGDVKAWMPSYVAEQQGRAQRRRARKEP